MRGSTRFTTALDALGHRFRRRLLVALFRGNPRSDDDTRDAERALRGTRDGREPVDHRRALRHVHLPKLEEYGYIEWDREAGEISKGRNWGEMEPILRLVRENQEDLPDGWL